MGKDLPYFPFYPMDFTSDGKVEVMSTLEVGAYWLLICKAWHETPPGSVPDDDYILARWARLTEDQWSQARDRVLACWALRSGRWFQPRLVKEYEAIARKRNVLSDAGKRGVEAKKNKGGLRVAQASLKQSESESDTDKYIDDHHAGEAERPKTVLSVLMGFGFSAGWCSQKARVFAHLTPDRVELICQHVRDKYPGRTLNDWAALTHTALNDSWVVQDVGAAQKAAEAIQAKHKEETDAALMRGIEEAQARRGRRSA